MSDPHTDGFVDVRPGAEEGSGEHPGPGDLGGHDMVFVESADDLEALPSDGDEPSGDGAPDHADDGPALAEEAPGADSGLGSVAPADAELALAEEARAAPPPARRPRGSQRLARPPRPGGAPGGPQRRPSRRLARPPGGRPGPAPSGRSPRPPTPPGPTARPRPTPGPGARPPAAPSARARSSSGRLKPSGPPGPKPRPPGRGPAPSSGGHAAVGASSGAHRALGTPSGIGPAGAAPSAAAGRAAEDRERTEEERLATRELLLARAHPAPQGDPWIGRDLGPFKVERFLELDRGERRYLATVTESSEVALLRVFPLSGSYKHEFRRLAERAERAVRVDHPHLARCLGSGRTKEAFFVGVEPPLGPTLDELEEPLGEEGVRVMVEQVARGLSALHARDLAHCHLSPRTIRRERPGRFVVCDPGLARPSPSFSFLAAGGDVLGRAGYIAPETVDTGLPTPSSDLYALGCVAWTLLAGRPPFTGDDEVQVLLDQLNAPVPGLTGGQDAPPVSQDLAILVGKLCGYTPDSRYASAKDAVQELKALERGEPLQPFPSDLRRDPFEGQQPKLRSGPLALVVVGLLLLTVGVLGYAGMLVFQARAIPLDDPLQGLELPIGE